MTTSLSPIRFPALRHTSAEINAKKAEEFQSLAQLVEDLIPNLKSRKRDSSTARLCGATEQQREIFCGKHGQTIKAKTSRNMRSCWQ
jgi:hypothetical protein